MDNIIYVYVLFYVYRCGLVALAMANSIFNKDVTVEQLSEASQSQGFSKQGEIFSCKSTALSFFWLQQDTKFVFPELLLSLFRSFHIL